MKKANDQKKHKRKDSLQEGKYIFLANMADQSPKQTKKQQQHQQQQVAVVNPSPQKLEEATRQLKEHTIDDETGTGGREDGCSFCSFKCLLCCLMLIGIIVAVISAVLLLSSQKTSNPNNNCPSFKPFKQQNYRLFATKTLYNTANFYLNRKLSNKTKSLESVEPPHTPSFFADTTLESIHRQLVDEQKCRPIQLHFYGRHAARYPSPEGIQDMNKRLASIQDRIKAQIETETRVAPVSSNPIGAPGSQPGNQTDCLNPLSAYASWNTFLKEGYANQLLDVGYEETRELAERLRGLYPEFFDSSQTNIDFGVTSKKRTQQTAAQFASLIHDNNFGCKFVATWNDTSNSGCYSRLVSDFRKPEILEFHEKCSSLFKSNKTDPSMRIKDTSRLAPMAEEISSALHLTKGNKITPEEVRSLYNVCKYEAAHSASSIWCDLFGQKDLKFLEYIEDLDDYFNVAYGQQHQRQSACKLGMDLNAQLEGLDDKIKNQTIGDQKIARFFFTHSEVIEKIFANLIGINGRDYQPEKIADHLDSRTPPTKSNFQTSLLAPFSSNIMFSVYHCPMMTSDEDRLKVVTSVNERPILVKKCKSKVDCLFKKFAMNDLVNEEADTCDLETFCKVQNTIFT